MDQEDEEQGGDGSSVDQVDLIKSYLAFARRALSSNKRLAIPIAATLSTLTVVVAFVLPPTYSCTTVLATKDNRVLDGDRNMDALSGASEVILSSDNIEAIVDQLELSKHWESTLPPLLKAKQSIMSSLRGAPSERDKREALIGMVQSRISVIPPGWRESKLTINVDWHDGKTAAAIADAAEQSFLKARHVAEISTITEYIVILEGHAKELREEIQGLAAQMQGLKDERLAKVQESVTKVSEPEAAAPAAPRRVAPPRKPAPTADLSELRAEIDAKQRAVKEIEDQRQRRISDLQTTLTEMRARFTPAHPMVVAAEHNIEAVSQDTPQLSALRSDLAGLQAQLKAKTNLEEAAPKPAGGGGGVRAGAAAGPTNAEPLPSDIMRLMQDSGEEQDPTIGAQFRTAVNKYTALRDKIGTARVDLDTAQAAFKHRYQIVIPPEAPLKPSKPKIPVVIAAGLFASLLLAMLVALIAELRKGKLVERWQVYQLGIPLLAELRWPPRSGE